MIEVETKAYGWGKLINYDPRFPGYFNVEVNIKGKNIIVKNLKLKDLNSIIEKRKVKCIKDDIVELIDVDRNAHKITKKHAWNKPDNFYDIVHSYYVDNNLECWDVYFDEMIDEENHLFSTYYEKPEDKYNLSEFLNFNFKYD